MTSLPKQMAGQKGNKPPVKKAVACRKTVPYEQRLPLLTSNSTGMHVPSTTAVSITSSGN